jgi:hypothetical protein
VNNQQRFNGIFFLIIILVAWMGFCDAREKAGAFQNITATYIKFEVGDYNHAIFLDISGKELSFWCSPKMIDFLERHKGKKIDITYTIKEVFIPEAKNKLPIEIIDKVKVGRIEFKEPGS